MARRHSCRPGKRASPWRRRPRRPPGGSRKGRPGGRGHPATTGRSSTRIPWPLVVIIAAQAAMSIRLIWSNTAYLDEATYLWAGHVELAHWLHGAAAPEYATYFSGAPVIYPPLGALAADVGGLAGARFLSLAFMLGATCLLWGMTRRLFGPWAAYLSAALFAALGPTQFLGAFATYDAMALFLIAAAAWCVVAAPGRDDSSWLLIAGAVLLALANATKYASLLFDPTVVALGGLTVVMGGGAGDGDWPRSAEDRAGTGRDDRRDSGRRRRGAAGARRSPVHRRADVDHAVAGGQQRFAWRHPHRIGRVDRHRLHPGRRRRRARPRAPPSLPRRCGGRGSAGRIGGARAACPGPHPHRDLAIQARRLRGLVRGRGGRLPHRASGASRPAPMVSRGRRPRGLDGRAGPGRSRRPRPSPRPSTRRGPTPPGSATRCGFSPATIRAGT